MGFGDKLKKLNKITVPNDNIIKKETKKDKNAKRKIYSFMVTKGPDEDTINELLKEHKMGTSEFIRDAIEKAYNIKFEGDYSNTGRRGK